MSTSLYTMSYLAKYIYMTIAPSTQTIVIAIINQGTYVHTGQLH